MLIFERKIRHHVFMKKENNLAAEQKKSIVSLQYGFTVWITLLRFEFDMKIPLNTLQVQRHRTNPINLPCCYQS